jgi:site-specific DNA-cytosine methylase
MKGILGVAGGNGVILHPFKRLHLIANIEPRAIFNTPNHAQWKLNFNEPLELNLDSTWANVNVIVGAPDCGHSSVLAYSRGKKLSDPRDNPSLQMYIASIRRYKPKLFLMENLPKMLENFGNLQRFLEKKYHLINLVEPVSAWGNSQVTRKRLVMVGIRKDLNVDLITRTINSSMLSFDNTKLQTSGQLIKGLEHENPELCNVRENDTYEIPLYYEGRRKMTTLEAKEIWGTVFKGKTRWEVNMGNMKCQPGVYRNLENDFPKTVRKQNRQFNHLGDMLTPREMARIQGVPDSFKLWYDESKSLYCINKARATVTKSPPYEIGQWFSKIIKHL